jgi:transposase-like protein
MRFIDYYNYFVRNFPTTEVIVFLGLMIVFYLIVIVMRFYGVMKKGNCPRCYGELFRTSKTLSDRILVALTLGILPLRRYKCRVCQHEVLRWNTEKSELKKIKKVKPGLRNRISNE